jgi:hypothetical protein
MVTESFKHRLKREAHEERNRKLLRDYQEYQETEKAYREVIEYVELPNPIFIGYDRTFEVRDDIAKTSEGDKLKELLNYINIVQFSKTKDFLTYPQGWWYHHRKKGLKLVPMIMNFYSISEYHYNNKLPDHIKYYFYKHIKYSKYGPPYNIYSCWVPLWKFKYKVTPHYIRYVKKYDTTRESEYHYWKNHFSSNNYWNKIWHLKCEPTGYYDDWDVRDDYLKNKILVKDMINEAQDYFIDIENLA